MKKEERISQYEEDLKDHTPDDLYSALKFLLREVCVRLESIEIELEKSRVKR